MAGESIRRSWGQPLGLERGLGSKSQTQGWEVELSSRRKEAAALGCVCTTAFFERKNTLEVTQHS